MARYTFLVDDGDFAGVGKLFARGELDLNDNPPASGADAVEAFLTKSLRTYGDGTPRTHHVSSNSVIEIEGSFDAAHAWSHVTTSVYRRAGTECVCTSRYRWSAEQ